MTVVVVAGGLARSVPLGDGALSSAADCAAPVTAPVSVVAVHAEIVTAASAANAAVLRVPERTTCDRVPAEDISTPPERRDRD